MTLIPPIEITMQLTADPITLYGDPHAEDVTEATAADALLLIDEIMRHQPGCDCRVLLCERLNVDQIAFAVRFAQLKHKRPGVVFDAIVEDWSVERIHREMF